MQKFNNAKKSSVETISLRRLETLLLGEVSFQWSLKKYPKLASKVFIGNVYDICVGRESQNPTKKNPPTERLRVDPASGSRSGGSKMEVQLAQYGEGSSSQHPRVMVGPTLATLAKDSNTKLTMEEGRRKMEGGKKVKRGHSWSHYLWIQTQTFMKCLQKKMFTKFS